MNEANVQCAIVIMRRAGELQMTCWQDQPLRKTVTTEKEAHACNTAACFAGWVALSPEFQADGGKVYALGAPKLKHYLETSAIAEWLGISLILAEAICATDIDLNLTSHSSFYEKSVYNVTAEDVIEKLELILKGELI